MVSVKKGVKKMTQQELIQTNIRKGAYIRATWKSEKEINGIKCEKISNGVVRFVNYENMASTKEKRTNGMVAKKTNGGNVIIKDILYQANNGSMLVSMKTTKNQKQKTHSTYKISGVEVDKATYETMVKPSAYNDSGVFTIKLENLISLG